MAVSNGILLMTGKITASKGIQTWTARSVGSSLPNLLSYQLAGLLAGKKTSIFHGCMVWIEKSVMRVTDRHHDACRVMPNSDPE